jgi:hypothetical protein
MSMSKNIKETLCQLTERKVLVVEKAGSGVNRVRYILLDPKPLAKHEQLKQRSLERRKQKASEAKTQ